MANGEELGLMATLFQSDVPGYPCRRGKVRDVYDLGDRLVLVATDRLSAFDWVLPTPIPDKGRILTALTLFWLDYLHIPHHLLSTDVADMGPAFAAHAADLAGRTCLVRKASVVPIECVVRGYLAGSGWKEYQRHGTVCGLTLPPELRQSARLPEPIFTPATKEESGHDQNISFADMEYRVGGKLAVELRRRSLDVYRRGAAAARLDSRRHQIRVGTPTRRRNPSHRRSADTGQFALLAGGRVSRRRQSALVRQAIRARLVGDDRLGQEQSAAGIAAGGRRAHRSQVSGSIRTPTKRGRATWMTQGSGNNSLHSNN
jgi:phosphoribosylaminoimidazole-succinocarboxamide synthase